jgi:hypothetical protein
MSEPRDPETRRGPARVAQVLVVLAAVVLAVVRFMAIDANSHSASDTLRPWFIQAFAIAVIAGLLVAVIDRVARRSSGD